MSGTVAVEPELESFFRDYGSTSLSDPAKLVARYAECFIVGGPRGSAVFTNDATFVDWLQDLQQFNQRVGMTSMTVVRITDTRPLSDRHVLPTVEWGATFTNRGSNDHLPDFVPLGGLTGNLYQFDREYNSVRKSRGQDDVRGVSLSPSSLDRLAGGQRCHGRALRVL